MRANIPVLFVEINYNNYIFVAGAYDDNQNFKLLEKIVTVNEGVTKNKFSDIIKAQEIIKTNVQLIEKKLDHIFEEIIIILDFFDYFCLNFSGFKKLNGSQVLEENISYIINSLKQNVNEYEKENNILHIFNSKSILDGTSVENLPIGLFGNFYSHELTFFMIKDNDFKNIKQIFNNINYRVKKILLKPFIEGAYLINNDQKNESFFKIKINKERSQIIFFEKSSFRYVEHFNFGSDIILKDIMKVCSINRDSIDQILLDRVFKNEDYKDEELLEEKYFKNINYRKLKKKLIVDIVNARVQEVADLIFNKNINIKSYKKITKKIFISIEDNLIFENFNKYIKSSFLPNLDFEPDLINNPDLDQLIINAANLSIYGWKKEAIPIIQNKNSLIARIFKTLFN